MERAAIRERGSQHAGRTRGGEGGREGGREGRREGGNVERTPHTRWRRGVAWRGEHAKPLVAGVQKTACAITLYTVATFSNVHTFITTPSDNFYTQFSTASLEAFSSDNALL